MKELLLLLIVWRGPILSQVRAMHCVIYIFYSYYFTFYLFFFFQFCLLKVFIFYFCTNDSKFIYLIFF